MNRMPCTGFWRSLVRLLAGLGLTLLAIAAAAQSDGEPSSSAGAPISVVPEVEREALRRTLAEPMPEGATPAVLRRHFERLAEAARRLSEPAAAEALYRSAMERLPQDAYWPNQLAWQMRDAGRLDEALQLFERASQLARQPADKLLYEANRVAVLVVRGQPAAAAQVQRLRQTAEGMLPTLGPGFDRVTVLRVLGAVAAREADLHGRRAMLFDQLASRTESERYYQESLQVALAQPGRPRSTIGFAASSVAFAQRERAAALSRLGRHGEAQSLLDEHLQFIQRHALPGATAAGAHHAQAGLRIGQRQFAEAERQLRLAIQSLDDLRYPRSHPHQVSKVRDLALVLWARGDAQAAQAELRLLDERLQRDAAPEVRGRMPYERGLVAFANQRHADAARQFEELERSNRGVHGAGHFYVAQAQGLRAVALWRSADPAQREAAGELLKTAVLDLLSPRNADFLDDLATRRLVRELIFQAYLEAMAERGGLQSLLAMGVADRLIAGTTAQAVADAAVRSAANDPVLADLVRREQDARAELQALQQAGGEATTAGPDETTRRRIGDLELLRQQLQERIRARYPGYDQLLRPPSINPTDVAQRLRRDEVLLLAMPTERALLVWAVTADELPLFARVDLPAAQLAALVARYRQGVDLGLSGGRLPRFDTAASHELYRQVLAPVAARLQGRRHLIVATAGPLAQVPFAALLTTPATAEPRPWLGRQLATSQVPSVAAWLAMRQLPPGQSAPEALLAWADPTYAPEAPAAAAGPSGLRQLPATRSGGASAGALRYQDLPALPETRDEVLAIAAALKADAGRDLILGARATRESVIAASRSGQLARKRVVVFATHGLMAGDLPGLVQPALALAAAAPGRDALASLIGLDDVLSLKLNADWVVLSACNTAAGDGQAGEALSGLARGFLYAGSRSLMVTHWAVESESARLLTSATFQHHVAQPNASKAESLRQAMLGLMDHPKYRHPAYWAAFALFGDGAR